ncbi:MAG: oligosaccharide flippase family protein [Bacteroidales bacterium]|nr:oligosaccharide flippase family protein [Bacteroidales bacterium]MCM1416234.1 oligosaccharide flippase family protein [bacterium]MCM1424964.1 oligosaccharide flippase family protein [bacterium]
MSVQWIAGNLKNRIVLSAGLVSYLLLFFLRIPLSRVIGDAGVGLFAPAFEVFVLTTLVISFAMSRAVSGLIRYRVKRERYRNARKALRTAFLMNLFLGVLSAFAVLLLSGWIADILVLETLSRMAIMAAAPAVFLAAFVGIFRGYFGGCGMHVVVAHSQYIEKLAMLFGAVFVGRAFYAYGEKAAALKHLEAHAYAYGALGAMLGVMLSQIIAILHLLVCYVIYANTLKGRPGQDSSRRAETRFELQRLLLGNLIPLAVIAVLSNLTMLIDQRFFNYSMNVTGQGDARMAQWGSFYGKLMPLLGMGAAFACLFVHGQIGKIGAAYEREEHRSMRERIGKTVRNASIAAFPTAIWLAALAKPFAACIYGRATAQISVLAAWIKEGTALIVLFAFSFLFGQLLYQLRFVKELFLTALLSLAVHLLFVWLLVRRMNLGVDGLLGALILFWGVYLICAFLFLNRHVKYRPDWFAGIVFPFAAAAVSGVAVFLIAMAVTDLMGNALTILLTLFVGLFFYIFLLMLLRVIGETELHEIPFGFLFILLGRNIGVL